MNNARVNRSAARAAAALLVAAMSTIAAPSARAQVAIDTAWVRASVAGQLATGAFMDIRSDRDAAVVKVETPVAGVAEVHTMEMKDNLMTMRRLDRLELPAGKAVHLVPSGKHVMLMDLKQPLKNGEIVPIKVTVEYPDHRQQTILVSAEVRALGAPPPAQHDRH